ncbi:MAG: histidine kinase [Bacteroidota bacterium]
MKTTFIIYFLILASLCLTSSPIKAQDKAEQRFIRDAFDRADNYMETDHYDSAQVWLNKIYQKVSYRKPSLFTYFLTSRQAEVYYYNNLHQLGMQEALKAENIANVLNDSILIADAYNFIGLFYLNSSKLLEAKKYFKRALFFSKEPPYSAQYIELSKPYHIYGNLAEAFEKLSEADSAIFYCLKSLEKAKAINAGRGVATGTLNLAYAYLLKKQVDSAVYYFEQTNTYAKQSNDFDVELTSYSGLADCAMLSNNKGKAFSYLQTGFQLIERYPQLNDFYASMFLDIAAKVYKKYGEQTSLIKTLTLKLDIQTATYKRNNTQIQTLLLMGLQNEKMISNLELAESKNKQSLANTRLYVLLLLLLLSVIAFIAYRYYALQRLHLANLRSKISQDLHDEVGATLSGIAMYSYITKTQLAQQAYTDVNHSLDRIKDNAAEMVDKLNDIVWAVNPVQDHLDALLARLKEFALQIASVKDIRLEFIVPEEIKVLKLAMDYRKNIYLICKEAINNAVKYSEASLLQVKIEFINKNITIVIEDNGNGFIPSAVSKGNGLINMASRTKEINAKLIIDSENGNGTKISLICKLV